MDELFGGLGEMFGEIFGEAGAEAAMGVAELLAPEGRRGGEAAAFVYERYLCGGPRTLNINDR